MGLLGMAARTAVVAGTATHVAGNVQRRQQRRWAQKDASQQPARASRGAAGLPAAAAGYPPQQRLPPAALPPAAGRPSTSSEHPGALRTTDLVAQLQRLGDLHTQGAITDEEFTAAKAKLLGG